MFYRFVVTLFNISYHGNTFACSVVIYCTYAENRWTERFEWSLRGDKKAHKHGCL